MLNFQLTAAEAHTIKSLNLKSLSHPFNFYHEFCSPGIGSANLKFIFCQVNPPPKGKPLSICPSKKGFDKYNLMSLFSTFNGTLLKSLCRVNQSLVLQNFRNVTRGPSQKQPHRSHSHRETPHRWYENLRKITGKISWWSSIFANLLSICIFLKMFVFIWSSD